MLRYPRRLGKQAWVPKTALETSVRRQGIKDVGIGHEGRVLLYFYQNKRLRIPGPPFCHRWSLMDVIASTTHGLGGSEAMTKEWERHWSDLHGPCPSLQGGTRHSTTQEVELQTRDPCLDTGSSNRITSPPATLQRGPGCFPSLQVSLS